MLKKIIGLFYLVSQNRVNGDAKVVNINVNCKLLFKVNSSHAQISKFHTVDIVPNQGICFVQMARVAKGTKRLESNSSDVKMKRELKVVPKHVVSRKSNQITKEPQASQA
jgi:hypothetical protein